MGPDQLVAAVTRLVDAVRAEDADATSAAVATLERFDPEQAKALEYEVIRAGIEQSCPDGVDGDDLRDILTRTVTEVGAWWPTIDAGSLATVLTGSFGVHEPAEIPPPALVLHAAFVLAGLLQSSGTSTRTALAAGLEQIRVAQTNESA